MMNNDEHAITVKFKTFNESKKISFFWLTKCIYELQENNKFNILNFKGPGRNFFQNIDNIFNEQQYWFIYDIYKKYEIFEEIVKFITTKKRNKFINLPRKIVRYFTTNEQKEYFLKFINIVLLINLIKIQLKDKGLQQINNYQLFNKLNDIDTNVSSILNLTQLMNLNTQDQINNWLNNAYNYYNANISNLIDYIDEDKYDKIHELFYNFL